MSRRNRKKIASRYYKTAKPKFFGILGVCSTILAVCVLFALLAPFHWFFDLFSNFAMQYAFAAALLLVMAFPLQRYVWSGVLLFVLATQSYQLAPFWFARETQSGKYEDVKILQYNVNQDNNNVEEIVRWIISKSEDVDVVALLEVNGNWDSALNRIKWAYPYNISKVVHDDKKIVLFSRLMIDQLEVKYSSSDVPVIVMRGATNGYEIPFVLYGMDSPPPVKPSYAKLRNNLIMAVANDISAEKEPHKLIVADFNATPFSPSFRNMLKISGMYDSNVGQGYHGTWPSFAGGKFGIPIDNIVLTGNIDVENKELGPQMGSDHFPVITTLRFKVPE